MISWYFSSFILLISWYSCDVSLWPDSQLWVGFKTDKNISSWLWWVFFHVFMWFIWMNDYFCLLFVFKVLLVDPENSKLLLTCKKGLVKSKLPVVSEYKQCTRGLVVKGFVTRIKPNGVIVGFLNDIEVQGLHWWPPPPSNTFLCIASKQFLFGCNLYVGPYCRTVQVSFSQWDSDPMQITYEKRHAT